MSHFSPDAVVVVAEAVVEEFVVVVGRIPRVVVALTMVVVVVCPICRGQS